MRLSVVVGNPSKNSRTLQIAEGVAERVVRATGAERLPSIDLADHASVMFDWSNQELAALNEQVRTSDVVVVATPTYKASYTGLLKAFLDRYDTDALAGVTAIPVMTMGSPAHSLAVELTLRPLLVELGASVPTRGLGFVMSDMERADEVLDRWAAANLGTPGAFRTVRAVEERS
jgi:FMN reductase